MSTAEAEKLLDEALSAARREFGIPDAICLTSGGGVARILVSAALAAPRKLLAPVEKLVAASPGMINDFVIAPLKGVSLVGGLLAERPLLNDQTFIRAWRESGLVEATTTAAVNPIFRAHIHLLVRVQVAYCERYELDCKSAAPARHFEHLKALRYLLHASH